MAKRKRASLKDKSPESLGLTQKKGKGIDLLFGGPAETQADDAGQPDAEAESENELNVSDSDSASSDAFFSTEAVDADRPVDELGLPVALEAPPDDLILASAPTEAAAGQTGDEITADLATSPFAMPVSDVSTTGEPVSDANDLTGILGEESLPTPAEEEEEENLSSSRDENDLTGIMAEGTPSDTGPADDLSGIVIEEPAGEASADTSATDLSGLSAAGEDLAADMGAAPTPFPSPAPPPTTAAPISVSPMPATAPSFGAAPAASTMAYAPSTSTAGYTPSPPPAAEPAPPPPPRNIELEGLSGGVTRTLGAFGQDLTREDFAPKDELPDSALTVTEREKLARDDAITEKVLQYIGPERRNELFEEIRALHDEVATRLSGNKTDVSFALETLRQANDIIIEDPRQYDEALYRVALVKTMLVRKATLSYWSYRMGLLILLYGVIFTVLCILGYFAPIDFSALLRGDQLGPIFEAVWFSGLAGGLGGSVEIFWRLYYRVSVKQDFDPQYLMYYLVKPILGFVLGLIMYFLVAVGSSMVGVDTNTILPQAGTNTGFLLAIFLGFIAGFRQESVFDMIYVLVKKIAPAVPEGGSKPVIPVEEESHIVTGSSS